MAHFKKAPINKRCGFCGRLGNEIVTIKYARDPSQARGSLIRQIRQCAPCGQLTADIGTGKDCDKDRTIRYEKDLP
jgi:hypothetical protein